MSERVIVDRAGRCRLPSNVRFSNRPFEVKHFQTIRHHCVDVAYGLVLLFGIGTKLFDHGIRGQSRTISSAAKSVADVFCVRAQPRTTQLSHAAGHKAADRDTTIPILWPDHGAARPVRLCDQCFVRNVDPIHLGAAR